MGSEGPHPRDRLNTMVEMVNVWTNGVQKLGVYCLTTVSITVSKSR